MQNNLTAWRTEKSNALYEKLLHAQQSLATMNRCDVLLTLLFILSSCTAVPIKPSTHKIAEIHTMLVVPVESPPLEVIPDLIETRFPVYSQYEYQSMPDYLFLKENIYKNPGGVLIAGLVSKDDIVPIADIPQAPASMEKTAGLEPTVSFRESWMPTFILAEKAVSQLNGERIRAMLSKYYYPLPIASGDRTANLGNWRNAIEQWYDQNRSTVDYRQHGLEHVDAVLEVGIDAYRIFNAQTSLQVLIKLIDPNTRQVIGRISARTFSAENSPESLLNAEAEKFKLLVADMGAQLVADGLSRLGLPLKASGQSAAARLTP